ncbi:hypothetical protein [Pantoea wallisii]|nr:hypothetical protein [Pantoea wallisii]
MKAKLYCCLFTFLVTWKVASAMTTLSPGDKQEYKSAIIAQAQQNGLERVEVNPEQTFSVTRDSKPIGMLIQGKGWAKEVHPVCFIGWSKDGKHVDQFFLTIGQDEWEATGCHKISSVGVISGKSAQQVKIAVIYEVEAPDHYASNYYILGIKDTNDDIYYDQVTTNKFQNSYLKTIAELRKAYNNNFN